MNTFRNPIAPFDSPDPFITYDEESGYYYSLFTRGDRLELFRSRHAARVITDGDSKVIYTPGKEKDGVWGNIWAPEMHKGSDGFWYIYTSTRMRKEPSAKCLFIVKAKTSDPFGEWEFVCKPTPNVFSIDPTIYTDEDGVQYMCCSRVEDGVGQVLDIIKMKSPSEFSDEAATIAKAELDWELVPPYIGKWSIVEGAFFVKNKGRLFIIYSANGCWSDHYALGVLEHKGGSLCKAENWVKHPSPLFVYGNGVYGPGHASFFYSPDKTELWCAYHAMKKHNPTVTLTDATVADRFMNIQKVDFDETGYPVMTSPVGYETDLPYPSGEIQ